MQQHIVDAAISGDTAALEYIYNATIDRAYAIAFSIVKDEFEAQDITQEVYITVFQKLDTIEDSAKVDAWIARIVRNRAIDYTRKNHPELFSSFESRIDDEEFSYESTIEDANAAYRPDECLNEKETKRLIWEIINELPEKQKKCIILRYHEDLKIKDIAVKLGLSEPTVKSCLKYAHQKIEAAVKKLEKEGTKLYSFTPLTLMLFLRWMFREDKEDQAAAAALSATKAGSKKAVGVKIGKRFVRVARTVKNFTITQKIAATILSVAVVAAPIAGAVHYTVASAEDMNMQSLQVLTEHISPASTVSSHRNHEPVITPTADTAASNDVVHATVPTSAPLTNTHSVSTAHTPPQVESTEPEPTETITSLEATLALAANNISMQIGERISVEYSYSGNAPLSWSSSNSRVATIADGTITAATVGTTIISITDNTLSSEAIVTVSDPDDPLPAPDYEYRNGYTWNGEDVIDANGTPVLKFDMHGWYYIDPDNEYGCYNYVWVNDSQPDSIIAVYLPSWQIRIPDPNEDVYQYINGYEWDYHDGLIVDSERNPANGLHEEEGVFYIGNSSDVYKYTRALFDETGTIIAVDTSTVALNPQPDPYPSFEYKNGYSWNGFGYRTEDMPEFGTTVMGTLDEQNVYYFDSGDTVYTRAVVSVQREVIAVDPASRISILLVNNYYCDSEGLIRNEHGNGIYQNSSYIIDIDKPFPYPDGGDTGYTRVIYATSPYADDRGEQTEIIAVDTNSQITITE